jgi:hypothetical protein
VNDLSSLHTLEQKLESFLDQAVAAKAPRLDILDGLNRIDDLTTGSGDSVQLADRVGEWLAEHTGWVKQDSGLRSTDYQRLSGILQTLGDRFGQITDDSPAVKKIQAEIKRWDQHTKKALNQKLILKRGPESKTADPGPTVVAFEKLVEKLLQRYRDAAGNQYQILSVVDDLLKSAQVQKDRDALLLAAFIIYYLKLSGYKIAPYVLRLRQAEALFQVEHDHA